jgi:hypothetical protein
MPFSESRERRFHSNPFGKGFVVRYRAGVRPRRIDHSLELLRVLDPTESIPPKAVCSAKCGRVDHLVVFDAMGSSTGRRGADEAREFFLRAATPRNGETRVSGRVDFVIGVVDSRHDRGRLQPISHQALRIV